MGNVCIFSLYKETHFNLYSGLGNLSLQTQGLTVQHKLWKSSTEVCQTDCKGHLWLLPCGSKSIFKWEFDVTDYPLRVVAL